ncbi:MAG: hypothetical protein MI919_02285, partial [Holophagales bacterium]|nr:hypothetical protein [Holophagales bacterium]
MIPNLPPTLPPCSCTPTTRQAASRSPSRSAGLGEPPSSTAARRGAAPPLALGALALAGFAAPWIASPIAALQEPPPESPAQPESPEDPPPDPPRSVVPPEGDPDHLSFGDDGASAAGEDTEEDDPSSSEDATAGRDATRETAGGVEVVRARLTTEPGHRWVRGLRRLKRGIGRVEWSRQGQQIAYDKVTDLGYRGLYVGRADDDLERCLTCEEWDFRKSHVLSPTWHPSGRFLVATVQGPAKRLGQ